jgi:cysteinyl-tRNA synthetase
MNLTDVDDKIIEKLHGKSIDELTTPLFEVFKADLESLEIELPRFVKATESIKAMEKLIERIWQKGLAYERDGSIYLSVAKYAEQYKYGELQNIDPAKLEATGRVDSDEYDKDSPQDFALWKARKEGEPSWEIGVAGKRFVGRPGWHIECSAMSEEALGAEFDIHTGGVDLVFPHHENEIAQTRAATGKLLARFWVHSEFLSVDGAKMSKRLGNLITLDEVREKGFDPLDLRYLFLQSHYRSKQNFTWEALSGAAAARAKLQEMYSQQSSAGAASVEQLLVKLQDDLDTPGALAFLWDNIRNKSDQKMFMEGVEEILQIGITQQLEIPSEIQELVQRRNAARESGDFQASDRVREEIESKGYSVEDTPEGPRVVRKLN